MSQASPRLSLSVSACSVLAVPLQLALDYIAVKRYYNIFYLILLTIGALIFTNNMDELFNDYGNEIVPDRVYLNEASEKIDKIISQKSNISLFLFVPFAALNSFVLFRRKKPV